MKYERYVLKVIGDDRILCKDYSNLSLSATNVNYMLIYKNLARAEKYKEIYEQRIGESIKLEIAKMYIEIKG
ncbi:MAG: hypothetical protein GY782_09165 [Gammaproteobacteria bacterium]|nr:hypothetical protein [Gammaproteobacteria bacterium]